ncbi:hypothetical protein AYI70_g6022 [Smittium culicis]|uniref:Uncharacterized protein n=1 Tax=Smittium culicis TaxID=133412 RepID=A0A1R1XS52_9FUNG|nr:hypothetical protein AYI70_g8778 [Smittium culicis]OMJ17369.1 hypothetical protein AYI70_g6022 [Smittium culicis]
MKRSKKDRVTIAPSRTLLNFFSIDRERSKSLKNSWISLESLESHGIDTQKCVDELTGNLYNYFIRLFFFLVRF